MNRLLGLGLAFLPLCWVSMSHPRYGQLLVFMMIAVIVSAQLKNWWLRYFGYYVVLWVLVSRLFFMFCPSAYLSRVSLQTTEVMIYLMCAYLIIGAVIRYGTEKLYDWICIGAIIQSLIVVPQYYGFYPFIELLRLSGISVENIQAYPCGTLECMNFMAAYLAISFPFFFRKKWCWFIPVLVSHLLLSTTSSAVGAVVIGTLVYFNLWWLWVSGAVLVLGYGWWDGLFTSKIAENSLSQRLVAWKMMAENVRYPVWGHGVGALWAKVEFIKKFGIYLHNEYLQVFWEFGQIGLVLVMGYIITVYRGNRILFSAFCIACINCIGNYPMHLPPTAFLVIVIIGLIERERQCCKEIITTQQTHT